MNGGFAELRGELDVAALVLMLRLNFGRRCVAALAAAFLRGILILARRSVAIIGAVWRSPIAERLTAQGLSGPPLKTPVDVAERLLAVQGQDPRGARLAVRARTAGLSAADVDRALSEDRSLLITWLNRGTLHLVRSEDYPLLQALTTPPLLTCCTRRLRQEGVSEARGRARGRDDRARARRRGAADPRRSCATARRGRRADRGPGARPPPSSSRPCAGSPCAARWSASSTPTSSSATGSARSRRSTATPRSPSWPAATSSATARRTTATSPAGPACRCATPAPACRDRRRAGRARGRPLDLAKRPPAEPHPRAAPARRLRPAAARLGLARGNRRPAQAAGHQQRHLPPLRPGRRPRRRHLALRRGKVKIEHLGKVTKKAAAALEADAAARRALPRRPRLPDCLPQRSALAVGTMARQCRRSKSRAGRALSVQAVVGRFEVEADDAARAQGLGALATLDPQGLVDDRHRGVFNLADTAGLAGCFALRRFRA